MPNRTPLPVDEALLELLAALERSPAVVVQAPPGAGKTSRVPPALAGDRLAAAGRVVVLEPRRVAARAAARRIAFENDWRVGEEVGYQVRFDRRFGPATRVLVVTEGVLVAMLQRDPFLEGVAVVVFDEVHERSLDTDLALAMVRRVQEARPDLRLVAMSATVDAPDLCRALGGCPLVSCPGRQHPVEIRYLERAPGRDLAGEVAAGVRRLAVGQGGDLLLFLPGMAEILRCRAALGAVAAAFDLELHVLHGDLPPAAQDRALQRGNRRKVVLATNVAETSLTIDGVDAVVDSGLVKLLRFDPGCDLDRLELTRVSRASAEQRAGRAGRQGPGLCLRLWREEEQAGMRPHETPEIRRLDLSGAILQLLAWGESDPMAAPWVERPPAERMEVGLELLRRVGAVDGSGMTATGRLLAALPLPPRLGRLLLEGHRHGCLRSAALVAALLGERSPGPGAGVDLRETLEVVERAARGGSPPAGLDPGATRHLLRVRDQLVELAGRALGAGGGEQGDERDLARCLLAAFPDRLARRRAAASERAVMAGGRGVRLPEAGALAAQRLFLAVEVSPGRRGRLAEALVRSALPVEEGWLPGEGLRRRSEVLFDERSGRVVERESLLWGDLPIAEQERPPADAAAAAAVLAAAATTRLEGLLDLDGERLASFLGRLRCLRGWRPDLGLPLFDRSWWLDLLPALCQGRRSLEELRRVDVEGVVRGLLTRDQLRALEEEAPDRVALPSGSRVRLRYEEGRAPVLAVRIQELFGLAETPRVGGGRVAVVLHLLAPNGRAQQVTDDLAGFWERAYPEVRRQLRGRYPKHSWPDDPLAARAERGAKRRRPE